MGNKLLDIQHKWPLIARDMVMLSQPGSATYTAEDIMREYGLNEEQFILLCNTPVFRQMLEAEVQRMKALGPFAGFRLRAEAMASDIQESLYIKAKSGDMEDKTMLQLLQVLLKSAGLDGAPEKKDEKQAQVNTQVNISFAVPKLNNKKLSHMMELEQTNVVEGVS